MTPKRELDRFEIGSVIQVVPDGNARLLSPTSSPFEQRSGVSDRRKLFTVS